MDLSAADLTTRFYEMTSAIMCGCLLTDFARCLGPFQTQEFQTSFPVTGTLDLGTYSTYRVLSGAKRNCCTSRSSVIVLMGSAGPKAFSYF